jgi:hypothetical protein
MRFPKRARCVCHGGLTPPAPGAVAMTVRRENGDFRDAQTHIHKSGGREPAVGRIGSRWKCTANSVRGITTVETRAAGVSPPWVQLAPATAGVFVGSDTTVRRGSRALSGENRTEKQERRA